MSSEYKERVRYGRPYSKEPKNTLVTTRDGDTVFFGIARCNRKLDCFHKSIGKYIARQRLFCIDEDELSPNGDLNLHHSGLRGTVGIENVKSLLEYFNNIDGMYLHKHEEVEDDS